MDDFVFFTNSRFKLRWVIKEVYSILDKLKLKLALDKTYIGNISDGKGVDFLGYHIRRSGLVISKTSFANMAVNVSRLYEQHASIERMEEYLKNWQRWAKAKVGLLFDPIDFQNLSNNSLKKCLAKDFGERLSDKRRLKNKLKFKIKHKNSTPTSYPKISVCNGRLLFG
jgi:hypothetical protein